MVTKVAEQLKKMKERFAIDDEQKVLGYLEKVGYHRLSFYFKGNIRTEDIISDYIFDKILRHQILNSLEVVENALKSVIVNEIGELFDDKFWYMNDTIYNSEFAEERMRFIYDKILYLKENDATVTYYLKDKSPDEKIPDYIFFNKLTFGETIKVLRDMYFDYRKKIANYFGISPRIFDNWIFGLKYLRNLCSHHENIFNKTMTISLQMKEIKDELGDNNNRFITYFIVLLVFNKLLIKNYKLKEKILENMDKYNKTLLDFGQKENPLSELKSEALGVLVNKVYTKYIKNARFSS